MEKIALSEVIIHPRKREPKDLDNLIQSIKEIGLLNPITINRHKVLIAGYHRLMACKALGWQEIPAIIINHDNLKSELAQIDENIVRNQLTALENAEQLTRRKEIYEIMHPGSSPDLIKSGNLKQNSPIGNNCRSVKPVTFINDVVNLTSKSERSIRQYIQIGSSLSKEIISILKGTLMADSLVELIALCKVESTEKQKAYIEKVIAGEAKTIRAAIKLENPPAAKPINLDNDTVPTKAYKALLEELYDLRLKYIEMEKRYDTAQEELEKYMQQ